MAVNIENYISQDAKTGFTFLTAEDASEYAKAVAKEAVIAYDAKKQKIEKLKKGDTTMANGIGNVLTDMKSGAAEAAQNILTETEASTALVTGEILLDNIQTLADKLILSRLTWWQKLTLTQKNRELMVTLGTYAIVHAIKTGGFGLTKYRIDHSILRFVTLAANQKLLKAVVAATGLNTNIAGMLLSVPTVTKIIEGAE